MTMDDTEYERLLAVAERERAPLALRERIEADRERLGQRGAIRRRLRLAGVLAAGAAVAGVVVGLAVPGKTEAPTVLAAAALAAKPSLASPPPPRRGHPEMLEASVGGVRFPAWGSALRWTASGARSDELSGRATKTVFYDGPRGTRLGYTIVAGKALAWPEGSRTIVRRGVEVHVVRTSSRIVAAWRVHGRTCVISAPASVPQDRVVGLASVSTYS